MISIKLQIFLVIIVILGLLMLINMIVKYKLELKYSLLWMLFSITTIILALFPGISLIISDWLGIEKPVNAIFLLGILLIMVILFSLTLTISNTQNKIKQLTQEVGINKLEKVQLKEEILQLGNIISSRENECQNE
ncbi:DUF2304 domain-containing protein [Paenibacillus sp. Root444D2]|uniref:DUF2304 domain-containing protein n=1 Tax=Paenibacillus sp. Root444D2 TaxID=1736538 RepID=UPI00070A1C95|nr:DUF2304 domain-containing protein [Paenibacillus sp. Root444D2]KQX51921.1 hypothetical protein ASD40_07575 [Paenibacillus sp. Root444D2]